jgi:hypothetical protein
MQRLQDHAGSPAERVQAWRSVSVDFVNRIVGKYEPERAGATLEAVNKLFNDVSAQRTLVDQERAARNAVLLYGTGGLGAFGLLCLLVASMAGRKEEI